MWVKWKLVLVCLEIMSISTLDRFTVCAERARGSVTFWAHPMELLGDVGLVEARFTPFGDSVKLSTT
jgi:hypothetical protein